jgi:hypothetical protein
MLTTIIVSIGVLSCVALLCHVVIKRREEKRLITKRLFDA